MNEAIRLIVWDLDETFWRGTLTEGGIQEYVREHHDIVIELAKRGIMSSICSKNDFAQVKGILEAEGLWDYFVLPSISWEPKGPRIAALVDDVQLRPATILFIDDNPLNLAEARDLVPGLQTVSHAFIPRILESPFFKGKDDRELKRLKQYKLLERRKADEAASEGKVEDFLRKSNIRVRFDYDVIGNLDRAVELINRTNQLNFTKTRLPDDIVAAKESLKRQLESHELTAALVGVRDNYGDHGWCGIYILHNDGNLQQFAFSCRILGMQVETWLYRKLGRPRLAVRGEVLTDVKQNNGAEIDWIKVETGEERQSQEKTYAVDRIVARGGCDLMPVAHYFGMIAPEVVGEFNEHRFGLDGRIDHSTLLRQTLKGGVGEALEAVSRLGYRASDFSSALFSGTTEREIWLLSFWTDAAYALYAHKKYDIRVPFSLNDYHVRDARYADIDNLPEGPNRTWLAAAIETLRNEFDFIGQIDEEEFKTTLHGVFSRGEKCRQIFVLGANEYFVAKDSTPSIMQTTRRQNQWIADVASFYKNVSVVNIRDFVLSEAEVHTPYHFDRLVYYRLFVHIRDWISGAHTLRDSVGWAIHRTKNPETYLNSNLSAHALSRTAKFLLGNGRPHIALLFARQASQIEPETLTHCLVLIEALVASGKPLTLEDILPVIQTKGISGEALHQLGMSCFGAGRLELAATLFKHASSIEPLILHHRHRLANVLERQNKRLEALAILSSCMQDGDVNPHIRANVGRLLMDFGRSDEVAGSLKGWLRDDPDFVPYHALQLELDRQHRSASTG